MFQAPKDAYFAPPVANWFIKTSVIQTFHTIFLAPGIHSREFLPSEATDGL